MPNLAATIPIPLVLPVAVIGAGLSGLHTAYLLQQRYGIKALVFESRPRIGGRIVSAKLPQNISDTISNTISTRSSRDTKSGFSEEATSSEATSSASPPASAAASAASEQQQDLSYERYDLGPSWFWPHANPLMTRLVSDLNLTAFRQYDKGAYTFDQGIGQRPLRLRYGNGGGGASFRVAGGMMRVVDSLRSALPQDALLLGQTVKSVKYVRTSTSTSGQATPHIVIKTTTETTMEDDEKKKSAEQGGEQQPAPAKEREFYASHVIFAVPPRLLFEKRIQLDPKLSKELMDKMGDLPTWMAPHAKLVAVYDKPFWRAEGLSGGGGSHSGPLSEIHDATPFVGRPALFGFLGLDAKERRKLGRERLEHAAKAQLSRMFGKQAAKPLKVMMIDWSTEPNTASLRDVHDGFTTHPQYQGLPREAHKQWDGRLAFAGTEVATEHGGFLEGAVAAAESASQRIGNRIISKLCSSERR